MFEMYAFVAVFSVKILLLSVLAPLWLVGFLRGQIAGFISDRLPSIEPAEVAGILRRLRIYRTLGLWTAAVGLSMLALVIRYMMQPGWDEGRLTLLLMIFWFLQGTPLFLALVAAGRFHEKLKRSLPAEKRKALLQPRGLFDFVSPLMVWLAVAAYVSFVVVLLYVERHPFPGFAGLPVNLAFMTALYASMALAIFVTMRKMTSSPLQAREDRLRSVGLTVKVLLTLCIAHPVFLSMSFALKALDIERLAPAAQSVSQMIIALLLFLALKEQMRIPGQNRPGMTALAR